MKRLICGLLIIGCIVALLTGCTANQANNQNSLSELLTVTELRWEEGTLSMIQWGAAAPRVFHLSNGTLIAGCELAGAIITMISYDNGQTWGEEADATFYWDLVCANVNFYQYGDQLLMAYRAVGYTTEGFYSSLQVSVSTDNGKSWKEHSTIAENLETSGEFHGVWEPYLGILNGELTCFYANDSRSITKLQNIEYKVWRDGEWADRTIVSKGSAHNSRDGMPVWMQLKNGTYVCIIESSKYRNKGNPFILQLLWSADGVTWSKPVDIYRPKTTGSKAAAPGIVELPNGQLVISFQTDEDVEVKGDQTSVMKTIISDGSDVGYLTAESFTPAESVFGEADGGVSNWSGLHYHDGYLYAAAGTRYGAMGMILPVA